MHQASPVVPVTWSLVARRLWLKDSRCCPLLLCSLPAPFADGTCVASGDGAEAKRPARCACRSSGLLGTCAGEGPGGVAEGSVASTRQLSECRRPREHQLCLRLVWAPARNIPTSKEGKTVPWVDVESFQPYWIGLTLQRRRMAQRKSLGGASVCFLMAFPLHPWGAKIIKMLEELQRLTLKIDWIQRISVVWSQSYVGLGFAVKEADPIKIEVTYLWPILISPRFIKA